MPSISNPDSLISNCNAWKDYNIFQENTAWTLIFNKVKVDRLFSVENVLY